MLDDLKKQESGVTKRNYQLDHPALTEHGKQPLGVNWTHHPQTRHKSATESKKGVLELSLTLLSCVL